MLSVAHYMKFKMIAKFITGFVPIRVTKIKSAGMRFVTFYSPLTLEFSLLLPAALRLTWPITNLTENRLLKSRKHS